ncbi:MAG: protoporphyrinogen oxidase, partial [Pyrinomonadaceae bacterium]
MVRVGVIGAGISGLVCAFLLRQKGVEVVVFEKDETAGGNIQTLKLEGYTIELGPNSLLKSLRLVELVNLLGLRSQILPAEHTARKRYILSGGKLEAVGLKSFVNGYFSPKALFQIFREPFVRSKSPENESVAEFFERRFGDEFVDKLVDPFISGIYAGNPHSLSIRAAFPSIYEMEQNFGSLIVGAFRQSRNKSNLKIL